MRGGTGGEAGGKGKWGRLNEENGKWREVLGN